MVEKSISCKIKSPDHDMEKYTHKKILNQS